MKEYLTLVHMKKVTQSGQYFIPHHAVIKRHEEKLKKLRLVFNYILIACFNSQTDVFDISMRCYLKRFMFKVFITKM